MPPGTYKNNSVHPVKTYIIDLSIVLDNSRIKIKKSLTNPLQGFSARKVVSPGVDYIMYGTYDRVIGQWAQSKFPWPSPLMALMRPPNDRHTGKETDRAGKNLTAHRPTDAAAPPGIFPAMPDGQYTTATLCVVVNHLFIEHTFKKTNSYSRVFCLKRVNFGFRLCSTLAETLPCINVKTKI